MSIAVAIGISVWRGARRGGGPGRRPGRRTICPDGVVLGRFGRDDLRHNGPEHVLCFARTRSGKAVGPVVPTSLTWPASAIVQDGQGRELADHWRRVGPSPGSPSSRRVTCRSLHALVAASRPRCA
jgi:Type IV secretory system Conjugative DNA transfer